MIFVSPFVYAFACFATTWGCILYAHNIPCKIMVNALLIFNLFFLSQNYCSSQCEVNAKGFGVRNIFPFMILTA